MTEVEYKSWKVVITENNKKINKYLLQLDVSDVIKFCELSSWLSYEIYDEENKLVLEKHQDIKKDDEYISEIRKINIRNNTKWGELEMLRQEKHETKEWLDNQWKQWLKEQKDGS